MDLSNNATQIILAVVAIFAVGIAITITVRKKINKKDNSRNLKNVNAGGDIVFGNKKTNNR